MTAVITGAGALSSLGVGLAALHDGLARGQARVAPITVFDATSFPTRVAAEVPLGDATPALLGAPLDGLIGAGELERWHRRGVLRDRKVVFALLAAAEAWRQAGCGDDEREAGLSIALGLEQCFLGDFLALRRGGELDWAADRGAQLPEVRYRSTVDLAARAVEDLLGLRGATVVHASACAAGGLAVAHAASLIDRGAASIVVAGGSDSMINPLGIGGMARIGAPSPRNQADACRPFDRRRDGLAMGEGAAMFVVEDEERALARGARPLARVLGWGSTQDGYRATAPRPDGSAAGRAMARALDRAGAAADRVGYVNAHGTGTPLNDPAECKAIRAALGGAADAVPISSIKGAVGHAMAASGAIELAACLLPLDRGLLPGTAHLRDLDPECDLDVIGPTPRAAAVDVVLSNSFGFGGQNVCVALGRWA